MTQNEDDSPVTPQKVDVAESKNVEIVRGDAPADIELRCLNLCKSFIAGSWEAASLEDVQVKRISGGLTNQLWHIKLREDFKRQKNDVYGDDEPSEVAIKLFQVKHMKNYDEKDNERMGDIVILTSMADANIGPKIYGIFNDGFIQAYHEVSFFKLIHSQLKI